MQTYQHLVKLFQFFAMLFKWMPFLQKAFAIPDPNVSQPPGKHVQNFKPCSV